MNKVDEAREWRARGGALKPCPHCGNVNAPWLGHRSEIVSELDDKTDSNFAVVCAFTGSDSDAPCPNGCGATSGYRRTPEEAAAAWNQRAEEDSLREKIAELIKDKDTMRKGRNPSPARRTGSQNGGTRG